MNSEDLYHAVTELPDRQILEAEQPAAPAREGKYGASRGSAPEEKRLHQRRPGRARWIGALAAVLVIALSVGMLWGPVRDRLESGKRRGSSQLAAPTGTADSAASADPHSDPTGPEMILAKCALAQPSYPAMEAMPREDEYWKDGHFDSTGYDAQFRAWRDCMDALQPQSDYAPALKSFLEKSLREYMTPAEGEENQNRVMSPVNLYLCLSMLSEVTDGNTRAQLLELLGSDNIEGLRELVQTVWKANYRDDGSVSSLLGNSIWLRDDREYNAQTVRRLAEDYYASSFAGEMGSADYNKVLQAWLNQQTRGLLSEQINDIETNISTVLALCSTIYYKAPWTHRFWQPTKDMVFHGPDGDSECAFLCEDETTGVYAGKHFTAICKDLNEAGQMYFLLPDEGTAAEALFQDDEALAFMIDRHARLDAMTGTKLVHFAVPKFDVSSQIDLREGMKALGLSELFDPAVSDFSPLADWAEGLAVSQALHGARLMIDEEGCVAAAYTVIMVDECMSESAEEIDFTLDRPFVVVLTNNEGVPLFVAAVNRPVE